MGDGEPLDNGDSPEGHANGLARAPPPDSLTHNKAASKGMSIHDQIAFGAKTVQDVVQVRELFIVPIPCLGALTSCTAEYCHECRLRLTVLHHPCTEFVFITLPTFRVSCTVLGLATSCCVQAKMTPHVYMLGAHLMSSRHVGRTCEHDKS